MCNILVSACLLGVNCRYDGITKVNEAVVNLLNEKGIHLIPVCPEQLGGMATPRHPSERRGDIVINDVGEDVTDYYRRGAEETLRIAKLYHCNAALLKERSPSCGKGKIYDGTFSKTIIKGNGVTADLLLANGMEVFGESETEELLEQLLIYEGENV